MGPILVVAGSVRIERRSFRVAEYVRDCLRDSAGAVELIDPRDYPLPAFDGVTTTAQSDDLQKRCAEASGFVFVCPEWHAGVPGGLKNMLDYLSGAHFAGKPVGLVAVSSAGGGAIVLSHLRDIVGVLGAVLVGPFVPVRNVRTAFDESTGRLADERFDAYLRGALTQFVSVHGALTRVAQPR